MIPDTSPEGLEDRFCMPDGWRWHVFRNGQDRPLRFGTVAPKSGIPDAIVIGLQGLGEFTEKYFEVARTLRGMNLSFWMLDWQGQGKSYRHLKNPQKRHSTGFTQDVEDLHYFIMEYVKHSAVHPDVGRIPLVMLGHSMGANIGLHYLRRYPETFACAAFSAPMIGIKALSFLPAWLTLGATGMLREALDQTWLEIGGKGWHPAMRSHKRNDIHSTDPVRREVHNSWMMHDPSLQVGNITYGWLHEAHLSCVRLAKRGYASSIATPCLFALAGREKLVDNAAARHLAARMPAARTIEFPDAKHEILMECDGIREAFFSAFAALLAENNVKDKLKPF